MYRFKSWWWKCSLSGVPILSPFNFLLIIAQSVSSIGTINIDNGIIIEGRPDDTSYSITSKENSDGTLTTESITVRQDDDITIISSVTQTQSEQANEKGTYSANISVTIEKTGENFECRKIKIEVKEWKF